MEIYQALEGHKKKYLVFQTKQYAFKDGINDAKKFFKCSYDHLEARDVWVNGKYLYLENPHIEGFYKHVAINYISRREF